jgi:hypothetical protein
MSSWNAGISLSLTHLDILLGYNLTRVTKITMP